SINDNTNMWNAGNLGDRRPQVKFLWDHHLSDDVVLQVQNGLALADALKNPDLDANGQRDQESFGLPAYEGRLGPIFPSHVENEKVLMGVWTMWANEVMNGTLPAPFLPVAGQTQGVTLSTLQNFTFVTKGVGLDLRLPLAQGLTFQSELFYGQNLGDFRG